MPIRATLQQDVDHGLRVYKDIAVLTMILYGCSFLWPPAFAQPFGPIGMALVWAPVIVYTREVFRHAISSVQCGELSILLSVIYVIVMAVFMAALMLTGYGVIAMSESALLMGVALGGLLLIRVVRKTV